MELRVLQYFLAVAREGSFTKAAQLLHLTQPTLSRQLMQLEEELGVSLFRRSSHSTALTEEGILLKRRAEELLDLADKVRQELTKEKELSGTISIGSGEFQSVEVLSKLIADFHAAHPAVQFEIYSGNSENIQERIEQGNLDCGILMEPGDLSQYEYLPMPVKEQWGVLVCDASPLSGKESVRPADLIGVPLVTVRQSLMQGKIGGWLGEASEKLEIVARGNLVYNKAMLAKNGLGAVITLRHERRFAGLDFIPFAPALYSETVLAWKKAQPFSKTVQAFLDHACSCLAGISENTN